MENIKRESCHQPSPDIIGSDIFYQPDEWEDRRSSEQVAYDNVKSVNTNILRGSYCNGKAFDEQVKAVTGLLPFVDTPEKCIRFLDEIYLPDDHVGWWEDAIKHVYQNKNGNGETHEMREETGDEISREWEGLADIGADAEL